MNGDPHLLVRFLDAAFENVRHVELLRDLAQIGRRAFVSLRRGARNHFEVGDLGEAREDFILDAFGKIGVRFIFAQVFKWKNGD